MVFCLKKGYLRGNALEPIIRYYFVHELGAEAVVVVWHYELLELAVEFCFVSV